MALVHGLMTWGVCEVDGPEVFEDGLLVVLDGDHIVGASPAQAAHGLVLGMEGIDGDDAAGEVEALGEFAHGRDLVALRVHLHLPEDQAGLVLHRRHHHPASVFGLLGGTAQAPVGVNSSQ